jgi:FixJ family two-component response regulator
VLHFVAKLFTLDLMRHGFCYLWKPEIVWLHAVSDVVIALSYFTIPVLDVQMPGMDGLRLQSHLTSTGRTIPIVFVTAYSDESARERALQSGAICFLTKPFSETELLRGLNSAIGSPSDQ